jgi:hypothetical protein
MAQNTVTTKLLLDSSQFQASMDKAANKSKNFGQSMFRLGRDLSGALTLPLALAAKSVIDTVQSFDLAQRKIAALSGQTEIFESLSKSARELGESTIFTATEISELQLSLKKLGKSTTEIEAIQTSILNFSQALDTGLAESGEFVVQTLNRFSGSLSEIGDAGQQAAYVTDLFAAAAANSAVDAEKLRNSLNYVGSEAAAAGFRLDETTALIGLLADRGFDASRGGTALRRILAELAKDGLTAQESLAVLLDETQGYRAELEKFGLRGGGPKAALAGLNIEFGLLLETLQNSEGFLQNVADVMDDSLFASLKKVQSAAKEFSLSIGDDVMGGLKNLLALITDLIKKASDLPAPIKKLVVGLLSFLAVLGPIALGIGAVTLAVKTLGLAIATTPIGAALTAIAAIGLGLAATAYDAEAAAERVKEATDNIAKYTAQDSDIGVSSAALDKANVSDEDRKEAEKYLKRRAATLVKINNLEQALASYRIAAERQGLKETELTIKTAEALEKHREILAGQNREIDRLIGRAEDYQEIWNQQPVDFPQEPPWVKELLENRDPDTRDLGYGVVDADFEFEPFDERFAQEQAQKFWLEMLEDALTPSELAAIGNRWENYLNEASDKIDRIDLSWTDLIEDEPLDEVLGFTDEEVKEIQDRFYFLDNVVKEWGARFLQVVQDIGSAFSNFIMDVATGTKTLAESFKDNLVSAIEAVIRKLIALIITFGILKVLAGGTGVLASLANGVLSSTGGNLEGFVFNGLGFNDFAGPNGNVGINNRNLNLGGAVSGNQLVFATQRGINANYRVYG